MFVQAKWRLYRACVKYSSSNRFGEGIFVKTFSSEACFKSVNLEITTHLPRQEGYCNPPPPQTTYTTLRSHLELIHWKCDIRRVMLHAVANYVALRRYVAVTLQSAFSKTVYMLSGEVMAIYHLLLTLTFTFWRRKPVATLINSESWSFKFCC